MLTGILSISGLPWTESWRELCVQRGPVVRVEIEVVDVRRRTVLLRSNDQTRSSTIATAIRESVIREQPCRIIRDVVLGSQVSVARVGIESFDGDGGSGVNWLVVDLGDRVVEMHGDVGGECAVFTVDV